MGIQGLSKLIYDKAPGAVKEQQLQSFFGRRIAIDASMSIYQFIIAMKGFQDGRGMELTNEAGEVTSHLNGLFMRTLRLIDEGIKPIYVFDGDAPELKAGELAARRAKATVAEKEFELAKDAGNDELMERMSKRTVRVSREQLDDCKRLLRLMGVPVVEAPTEAEAQCAELVKAGRAWAVGTEDMDTLTFGAPIMLRHLNISEAKRQPIVEIHLDEVLRLTQMSMDQFIDLCILLGCDYVPKIAGIGPQKAWDGITKHKSIEAFVAALDTSKYTVPADFNYAQARAFFQHPVVTPGASVEIAYREPDEKGLVQFLVHEKLFNADRVTRGVARLRAGLSQKAQGRLDGFFTITKVPRPLPAADAAGGQSSGIGGSSSDARGAVAGKKRAREAERAVHITGTLHNRAGTGYKKAVKK